MGGFGGGVEGGGGWDEGRGKERGEEDIGCFL